MNKEHLSNLLASITMISWGNQISEELFVYQLDDVIDLVIPRGSNKLVSQIKESTKIPVLGHAGEKEAP